MEIQFLPWTTSVFTVPVMPIMLGCTSLSSLRAQSQAFDRSLISNHVSSHHVLQSKTFFRETRKIFFYRKSQLNPHDLLRSATLKEACFIPQMPFAYGFSCEIQFRLQNHRIVGVGRDLCGSSSPTPLPKQGHLQ